MDLKQVHAHFDIAIKEFLQLQEKLVGLIGQIKQSDPTMERIQRLEKVGTQCFGHMTTALEEVNFWSNRLNGELEHILRDT